MDHALEKEKPPRKKKKPMNIMQAVLYALFFVLVWATVNQYRLFGLEVVVHTVLVWGLASVAAWLTHLVFYAVSDWWEKKEFESFGQRLLANQKKIKRNVPFITATILAMRFRLGTPLFVVVIAAVLAELIGKLIWGGFGKNRVNPVAVGFLLTDLLFERFNQMPVAVGALPVAVDGITAATPLSVIAQGGWHWSSGQAAHFRETFGSWWDLLLGQVPAPTSEMARLAVLIAFAFLVYKKALDVWVPLLFVFTLFFGALVVGVFHGFVLSYPLYHVLTGGALFGAVFMATDPVTIPKNKLGRKLFAVLLGVLTLSIRIGSLRFLEGMMLALVVLNLLTPWINEKAISLSKANKHIQNGVLGAVFLIGIAFVLAVSVLNGVA